MHISIPNYIVTNAEPFNLNRCSVVLMVDRVTSYAVDLMVLSQQLGIRSFVCTT